MRFYVSDDQVFRSPSDAGIPLERWLGTDRWVLAADAYELSEEEHNRLREVSKDEARAVMAER